MLKSADLIIKHIKKRGDLFLLIFIIIVAVFIRTYRIQELSVFTADQALMSTEVVEILRGHFTLIGPSVSLAPIFFGPIVYYLMLPFYFLFKGYPLAGTVFQTILQITTIPFIYLIGKRIKNARLGLIAAFLFSISALLVEFSRATFNTTTALFFSTLIIYIFFSILNHYRSWKVIVMGILIGWIIQMNFITASLLVAIVAFPFLYCRKLITVKYFVLIIVGVIIGLSPYLLFEFRHNFLNIHGIINFLFQGTSGGKKSVMHLIIEMPTIISQLFFGISVYWLGSITVLFIAVATGFYIKKKNNNIYFNFLLFFAMTTLIVSLLYGKYLLAIYLIAVLTTFILIFSTLVLFVAKRQLLLIILLLLLISAINLPNWNLQKPMNDLQDGISMSDFDKTARIIQYDDYKGAIDVTMVAQKDSRAVPLRFFLYLYNIPVLGYSEYDKARNLYLILNKTDIAQDLTTWEYYSFGSDNVVKKWKINDKFIMYKLEK